MKKIRTNDSGVSLIELMMAIGILAVALSAVLHVVISTVEVGSISRHRSQAMLDAQYVMNEIRILRDGGAAVPEEIVAAFPAGEFALDGASLEGEVVTISYDDVEVEPLGVTVTVSWADMRGRALDEALSTILDGI